MARIEGFYHFRDDLGEGTRTGVAFSGCTKACFADSFFIPTAHSRFSFDEKPHPTCFSPKELSDYLLEERRFLATGKLGITFLGKEPLAEPEFCLQVGTALKQAGIGLDICTCGCVEPRVLKALSSVCDRFVVCLPVSSEKASAHLVCPQSGRSASACLAYLNESGIPFRIRVPVLDGVNARVPQSVADFCAQYPAVQSVWLDFSRSSLSAQEAASYRACFLERNLMLY